MPPAAKSRNEQSNSDLYMYVRSTTGDNRVAFHEIDDAHPGGSAFVAGNRVVKIGRTALAEERVRKRMLVEVKDAKLQRKADEEAKTREDALPEVGRPVVPDSDDVDEETGEITDETVARQVEQQEQVSGNGANTPK